MLEIRQVTELVIVPALETLQLYSKAAEQLVLGTALQESGLRYLQQLGDGPALGLWQMEPATHDDLHLNFLAYRPELQERLRALGTAWIPAALAGNLWYGAAMCRLHYYRYPDPLPAVDDIAGQAALWKKRYNTLAGQGTVSEYMANWQQHMGHGGPRNGEPGRSFH